MKMVNVIMRMVVETQEQRKVVADHQEATIVEQRVNVVD